MSHYRILRLAGLNYRSAVRMLRAERPDLDELPFDELSRFLFSRRFVYSDAFSRAMRALGHEAVDIIYDFDAFRRSWVKSYADSHLSPDDRLAVVLRQIEHYRPDIVYLQDLAALPADIRVELKDRFPFVRLIAAQFSVPTRARELKGVDLAFVGTPAYLERCARLGLESRLLYHAFDPDALSELGVESGDRDLPFTFIGTSGVGAGLSFQSRYELLRRLIRETPIELWIQEYEEERASETTVLSSLFRKLASRLSVEDLGLLDRLLKRLPQEPLARGLRQVSAPLLREKTTLRDFCYRNADPACQRYPSDPLRALFPARCHPAVFGMEMYGLIRRSRISFNCHSDHVGDWIGNMRLFEATGAGSCLLTDTGRNMPELFDEDREVVTYSSEEECVEKAKYLLSHDEKRRVIAEAGQRRTLRDHSIHARARAIDEAMRERM